jgi:hypothetical protein
MMLVQRLTAILLGGFLTLVVFAYANPAVDAGTMRGEMADHILCPEMGMTSACTGVLQHLAHWQSTFLAVLTEGMPLLLLLAAAVLSFWLARRYVWEVVFLLSRDQRTQLIDYNVLPRSVLQEAFSNGIIHSKAY